MIPALALLVLAGCRPKTLTLEDIEKLRVAPDDAQLPARPGQPSSQQFTAYAVLKDDKGEVELDYVAWSSSNLSAGDIDVNGVFTSVDTNGGISEITATYLGIEGSGTATVVYSEDLLEDGLSQDVADAFADASAQDDEGLALRYPPDRVTVPRNLAGLGFSWDGDEGGQVVYRIRFKSDITDISVYTTQTTWLATSELWERISASNRRGEVQVHVEAGGWDGSSLANVRRGLDQSLTVNRLDARGSVFYWTTAENGIVRIPFGSTEPTLFWGPDQTSDGNTCVGCHVMVPSVDKMVVTHDGINGQFSTISLVDVDNPGQVGFSNPDYRLTFKTVSPKGEYILGTAGSTATLYSMQTGQKLKEFEFDDTVTHPDWSPDGESILFVRALRNVDGEDFQVYNDMNFERGEIIEVEWDAESETLGSIRVLKDADKGQNFYYPAYSPDGEWIAYNRSSGECYAAEDAELWLMSRDGSIDVRLGQANGEGNQQNSYPRWGPLPDDDILWLAYSSRRTYPLAPGGMPQIWVTAIDPALALEGKDPSSSPFWLPGQSSTSDNHLPVWWDQ